MVVGIVVFLALMGYAVGKGRKDVVLTVGGYALAALLITVGIIFGALYLYTNFVYGLWVG